MATIRWHEGSTNPVPEWTIHALKVGELRNVPKRALVFREFSEETLDIPLIMFVIVSDEMTIVVDTGGPDDPEYIRTHHGWEYWTDEDHRPEAVLESLGIRPRDVDLVINTHLHWDHCSSNEVFGDAPVVLQKAELEYAVHPCPAHRGSYQILPGITPVWASSLVRVRRVDGRVAVAPGVEVIPLPGHTPGSQGVVVQCPQATYVITGDCVDSREAWENDGADLPALNASFTDLPAFYDSVRDLKESGWVPLFSHDEEIVTAGTFR